MFDLSCGEKYHDYKLGRVSQLELSSFTVTTRLTGVYLLFSVLKDVPTIPLEMLRSAEKDHARISLFPSLDYKALYNALVQLVDCVPLVTCGAHGGCTI